MPNGSVILRIFPILSRPPGRRRRPFPPLHCSATPVIRPLKRGGGTSFRFREYSFFFPLFRCMDLLPRMAMHSIMMTFLDFSSASLSNGQNSWLLSLSFRVRLTFLLWELFFDRKIHRATMIWAFLKYHLSLGTFPAIHEHSLQRYKQTALHGPPSQRDPLQFSHGREEDNYVCRDMSWNWRKGRSFLVHRNNFFYVSRKLSLVQLTRFH